MDGKTSNNDCLSREKSKNNGSSSVGVVKGFREKRMFKRRDADGPDVGLREQYPLPAESNCSGDIYRSLPTMDS